MLKKPTVKSLCDHLNIYPIRDALRAIERYNTEAVDIKVRGIWYTAGDYRELELLDLDTPIEQFRVRGIAWDGTDWEWGTTQVPRPDWSNLSEAREAFHKALEEHTRRVEAAEQEETIREKFDETVKQVVFILSCGQEHSSSDSAWGSPDSHPREFQYAYSHVSYIAACTVSQAFNLPIEAETFTHLLFKARDQGNWCDEEWESEVRKLLRVEQLVEMSVNV